MDTEKNIILLGNPDTKIFLLKDPLLETKIEKDADNHIKLELEYSFKTPLLFAFCFRIEEVRLPYQEGFYINEEFASKETKYSRSMIEMFIKNQQMIYNGSYYKLIN